MPMPVEPPKYRLRVFSWFVFGLGVFIFVLNLIALSAQSQTCDNPIELGTEGPYMDCFEAPLEVSDPYSSSCPSWYFGGGYWLRFEALGNLPVSIQVTSSIDYTFSPEEPHIWCHMTVYSSCESDPGWGTTACGLDLPAVLSTTAPGRSYYVDLDLPAGTYWIMIGNVGVSPSPSEDIEGCFQISVFNQGFLDLEEEDIIVDDPVMMQAMGKARKIYTPQGVFIETPIGTFDLTGRRVVPPN